MAEGVAGSSNYPIAEAPRYKKGYGEWPAFELAVDYQCPREGNQEIIDYYVDFVVGEVGQRGDAKEGVGHGLKYRQDEW